MRFDGLAKVLGILYDDTFTNKRFKPTVADDGTTGSAPEENPVQADVACRISFEKPDSSANMTDSSNPKNLGLKLFCNPDTDVKKGDWIEAQKKDDDGNVLATYTGYASEPNRYPSHLEIELTQEGDA